MAQSTGSQIADNLVNAFEDAVTFRKQRQATSDWLASKEDGIKGAYQRAKGELKRAVEGPTTYIYPNSKPTSAKRTVATKHPSTAGKTRTVSPRKRATGKRGSYGQ